MCDWCITHGAGEKWYLQAKNYSVTMLEDPDRFDWLDETLGGTAMPIPGKQ